MRADCVLLTDRFPVVKMCIHKMRRAVHLRRDEKASQIDLDGMSWGEEWLLALFFIFPPGVVLGAGIPFILNVSFTPASGYCNDVFYSF